VTTAAQKAPPPTENLARLAAGEEIVGQFLAAPNWRQRAMTVRDQLRVAPLMSIYYGKNSDGPITFDSSPAANLQAVSGGITTIGQSGNPVGTNNTHVGMSLSSISGSVAFTDLDVYSAGAGLVVQGTGAFLGAAGASGGTTKRGGLLRGQLGNKGE